MADTFDLATPERFTTSFTVRPDLRIAITAIWESCALYSKRAISTSDSRPRAEESSFAFFATV